MSEKHKEFVKERHTKNCSVDLEWLDDEKTLNKCLRKYGLKLAPLSSTEQRALDDRAQIHLTANSKPRKRREKRSPQKSVRRSDTKLRKINIKPLCYFDCDNFNGKSESAAKEIKECGVFSKAEDEKTPSSDKTLIVKSKPERGGCGVFTTTKGCRENIINSVSTSSHILELRKVMLEESCRSESLFQNIPEDSYYSGTDNRQLSCAVDGEIEVIKELMKPSSFHGKTSGDGKELTAPLNNGKRWLTGTSLTGQHEFQEDDSREDSEDDRVTVIFEDLHKDTDSEEVFEFEGKELVSKKLKNREITNRKKQRLVKFKRKRMAGKNLAKYRKPKGKGKEAEAASSEQEAAKKPAECTSEECLREVCGVVKRLHEFYRIILQLQRELPKNAELAVHFTRVIHAQQENFHREIRKAQTTIIKCYEKMLNFYGDTIQVTSEISRRTSLSISDIDNVVSRCIFVEGQCEMDKHPTAPKQSTFPPVKPPDALGKLVSGNLARTLNKRKREDPSGTTQAQGVNISPGFPPSHPFTPPEGINYHRLLDDFSTREKTPRSSDYPGKDLGWPYSDQIQSRGKPRTRKNCQPRRYYKDSRLEQFAHNRSNQINPCPVDATGRHLILHRPLQNHPVNHAVQYYNDFHAQNTTLNQVFPGKDPPPSSAASNVLIPNIISPVVRNDRLPNQECQSSKKSDSASELVSGAVPAVKTARPRVVNTAAQMTRQSEVHWPLDTVSADSVIFAAHNRSFTRSHSVDSTTQLDNSASRDVQILFDPTIPQKLTMRNCRLQAGPVLGANTKSTEVIAESKSRTTQVDHENNCTEFGNLDRGDLKSRVYVCAQNDCKNPGVRICKGCKSIIYCSTTCQFKHWILKHRRECCQLKALRG